MSSYAVSDNVKCLEGVDYNVVKKNTHFEWVTEFENVIKHLALEVFETFGVDNEKELKVAVTELDAFQENLKTKMDALVKQVTDNANVNEKAKSFVVEWADACKYQVQLKYHHMGDGPTAQKVRWSFESAIKYIIICATTLADNDEEEDFKKEVSNYVKNIIIQSLIDALENVKSKLKTLKTIS